MAAGMQVVGLQELKAKFAEMPTKVGNRILRTALRTAGKTYLAAVKTESPKLTGLLRRSLKLRAMKRKAGRVGLFVAPKSGMFDSKKGYYPAVVEYGKRRLRRASNQHRKQKGGSFIIPPNPYMKRAFEKTRGQMMSQLDTDIRAAVEAVAAEKASYNAWVDRINGLE